MAWRAAAPKCGARKRTDGEPCRNVARENGRCRLHGGATPKGRNWHKAQFPRRGAPLEKLRKKERELARRREEQARRVARMTPEEGERYEAWRASHRPGDPVERARVREARSAAAFLALPEEPLCREAAELAGQIERLEAERDRLAAELRAAEAAEEGAPDAPDAQQERTVNDV
ncbi:MAG: hypothetical protein ACQEUZ_04355 [Pseudomonadota bacterium]